MIQIEKFMWLSIGMCLGISLGLLWGIIYIIAILN